MIRRRESVRCFEYNGSVQRNGVVINGIPQTAEINDLYAVNDAYRQIDIDENIIVSDAKPDVEQIQNVNMELCLEDAWTSPSGFKVFMKGVIWQKITYTACNAEQTVHTIEKEIPFSHFIDLRQFGAGPVPLGFDPFNNITLVPEDAFVQIVNGRKIFKDVIVTSFITVPGANGGNGGGGVA